MMLGVTEFFVRMMELMGAQRVDGAPPGPLDRIYVTEDSTAA